jgi:hypothetical protein
LLGWDVSNRNQLAPQDLEVVDEPSMDWVEHDGLRSRQPDYLFRVSGFSRFIFEAKKAAVDPNPLLLVETEDGTWGLTILNVTKEGKKEISG